MFFMVYYNECDIEPCDTVQELIDLIVLKIGLDVVTSVVVVDRDGDTKKMKVRK